MRKELEAQLEALGMTLGKFSGLDTRRIGGDGTVFRWYTAKDGFLQGKFGSMHSVQQWADAELESQRAFRTRPPGKGDQNAD